MVDERVRRGDRHVYWRLLGYGRGMLWLGFAACVGYLTEALATAGLAEVLDRIINAIQQTQPQTRWQLAGVIVGAVLLRGLGGTLGDLSLARVSYGIVHKLRCVLFERLLHLPSAFFDRSAQGHLLSRITFNVAQVRDTATDALKTLLEEGAMVFGLTAYLLYKNWKLTLVFVVIAPAVGWVMGFAGRRFRRLSRRIQTSMGDVTQVASEAVTGYRVVRTFGGEAYERQRFHSISDYNLRQNMKMAITKAGATQIVQLFTAAAVALLVVLVFEPSLMHGMSAGGVIAYITAAGVMLKPTRKLAEVNALLQRGLAAAEDIFTQIDADTEQDHGDLDLLRARGRIEFRNVSFGYERANTNSLADVSFVAEPGMTIALVGRSGSGKTTLASLIARFYAPTAGEILLDDQPLARYRLSSLRRQIALVGQDVTLFNDTVARNIAYGELSAAPLEAIRDAARRAHASAFIDALPNGLETSIGDDGVLLSGGQRQRLAIARAILKDAPILILDEATSALDSESERVIQAALNEVMRGRTTFVIAHRLSTIERADLILVIDAGHIVEQGTHIQLLAARGVYAQLHESQFSREPAAVTAPAVTAGSSSAIEAAQERSVATTSARSQQSWYGAVPARWYEPATASHWLAPVARLYAWAAQQRRDRYQDNPQTVWSAPVPVVIVGNIVVGGTGKTPFVIWLVEHLQRAGWRPGVVARGYGGKAAGYPLTVTAQTSWRDAGDEPPMIAARTGCPVVVAPDRVAAVQRLLQDHDCDIVISDDGLQHYALGRSVEFALVDGARGVGNGLCLPAGPLRESVARLLEVDLVISTGVAAGLRADELVMALQPTRLVQVLTGSTAPVARLRGQVVHAFAGIGNPARFFATLRSLGATVIEHALADHQPLSPADLLSLDEPPREMLPRDSSGDDRTLVVMTEKDAIKCRALDVELKSLDLWYLEISACFAPAATAQIDAVLEARCARVAH